MKYFRIFPPLLEKPEVDDSEVVEKEFEMVTETDLEFLDDSDEDYDSEDEDYDSKKNHHMKIKCKCKCI